MKKAVHLDMASSQSVDCLNEMRFFMRCTICLDTLKDPRTLPCLHTFCTHCLQGHVDATVATSGDDGGHFVCPACREEITLPRDGVVGFRRDFRVEQMRDFLFTNLLSGDGEETMNGLTCAICMGHFDSLPFYCRQCRKSLCDMCARIHSQITVFVNHSLEQYDPEEVRPNLECVLHPTDVLDYICEDCVKLVCSTCIMKEHGDHVVVEKLQGVKEMIRRLDFQQKAARFRQIQMTSVLGIVNDQRTQLQATRSSLICEIKAKVKEVIEDLYRQEAKLIQDLERHVSDEEMRLDSVKEKVEILVDQLATKVTETEMVLGKNGGVSLLQKYHDLEREITELVEKSMVIDLNPSFVAVSFSPNVCRPTLGRIRAHSVPVCPSGTPGVLLSGTTESTSESESDPELNDSGLASLNGSLARSVGLHRTKISLLARLGRYGRSGGEFNMPRDVCFVGRTNQFAVCDTNNERIQLFDSQGLLVGVIGQNETRPWGIASSEDGQLLVADNADKCVKVFDASGRLLRKIGSFLCPCGIAVNSRGHVIVTDFFSTYVYVLDSGGEIVHRLRHRTAADKHACGPSSVAVTFDDDVVISDVSNASLKAYNRRGRHLWTIRDFEQLPAPRGVCVTGEDIILVGDSVSHRIMQFNIKGEYLGVLETTETIMKEPTSLAVSKDNMLLIGRMNASEISVYQMKN